MNRRGPASVEFRSVTKRYGAVTAVDQVSFTIAPATLVTLLGPSGCGKTTTLRLIAGLEIATEGRILIGGDDVTFRSASERDVSMVFQSYALFPHMSVLENVAYGPTVQGLPKKQARALALEKLDLVGLSGFEKRSPSELSGGQQQRVALARALVVEPEILLLDEPLSNLDANLREEMRFEVRRLHDQYRYTSVYVTHDQSEAMTTADLIAVMNAGKIEQAGSPEDIYYRPRSEFVARFIGASNILRGKGLDRSRVEIAGVPLRCTGAPTVPGQVTPVSVRQHDIRLTTTQPSGAENVVPATVVRQVFLGSNRDYVVELAGGTQLRVLTQAEQSVPAGSSVWLHLPPERCRALAG